jgi:hypothetical protein
VKEFRSFAAFAGHLIERSAVTAISLRSGLKAAAVAVERTAKEEIGQYQPQVGPFPAWEPLAESTVADRVSQGFSPDEPLLRAGDLKNSISHSVEGLEALVGSTSDVAIYQEMGTLRIPPRPFLGPAAMRNEHKILEAAGAAAVSGIVGGEPIAAALGYDFTAE